MTDGDRENKDISKKLVNDPKHCVSDALKGLVLSNSRVKLLEGWNVILRSDIQKFKEEGKVSLITGGGSGHEPFGGGYVGKGFLTACVAGDVFTSPSTASIVQCIRNCYTPAGVLLIFLNYTGDRLNFGKAAEILKSEGKVIDVVVVGEDCAVINKDKSAGRRGLCGAIPVFKIAGAMAEDGKTVEEIASFLRATTKELCTISISLSSCSIPGKPPGFTIPENMYEFGLGVHGEAGVAQLKMGSASSIMSGMINHVKGSGHMPSQEGKEVAIVVNNLGGTSNLELSIMAKEAIECLVNERVLVKRCYVGSFITSLEMAGVSLTIMILNEDRLKYIDAYCDSSVWPKCGTVNNIDEIKFPSIITSQGSVEHDVNAVGVGLLIYDCLKMICNKFITHEENLNKLDRAGGDGDTGTTFAKCAKNLLTKLVDPLHVKMPVNDPHGFMLTLAQNIEETMGGSSGALISLFLTAAANGVKMGSERKDYINSFQLGIAAVEKYGGAEEGDRTMLDAMYPTLRALQGCATEITQCELLNIATKASSDGAQSTINMHACAGRASYVSHDRLLSPDPGAVAVSLIFESIAEVMQKHQGGGG